MTRPQIEALLEGVRSWPREDQEELFEAARDIEARRTGVYRATVEELAAIDEAEQFGVAAQNDVDAAFKAFRRA